MWSIVAEQETIDLGSVISWRVSLLMNGQEMAVLGPAKGRGIDLDVAWEVCLDTAREMVLRLNAEDECSVLGRRWLP